MSRATEIAEREAREAEEAEAADDDDTATPTAPEPEPNDDDGELVGEAALAAMEKENERHARAVLKLLGPAGETFMVCPLCETVAAGFVPDIATMPPEMQMDLNAAVGAYFAGQGEPDYPAAKDSKRCENCNGLGQLLSGSLMPSTRLKACTPCGGLGYVPVALEQPVQVTPPAPPAGPPPVGTVEMAYFDVYGNPSAVPPDHAGRAFLHPAYGHPVGVDAPIPGAAA